MADPYGSSFLATPSAPTAGVLEMLRGVGGWPGPSAAAGTPAEREVEREAARSGPADLSLPWFLPYFDDQQSLSENGAMRLAYRRMPANHAVKAAWLQKLLSVSALDVKVIPAKAAKTARRAQLKYGREADFARWAFTEGLSGGTSGLIWGVLSGGLMDGYSLCEKVWAREEHGEWRGHYHLRAAKPKDAGRDLVLKTDEFRNLTSVMGLRYNGGREFHPAHFIYYRHLPLFDVATGQSDFRAAYGPWWRLDTVEKLRIVHLEKRAGGMLVGTYENASQAPSFEETLKRARSLSWAVIPPNTKLELLNIAGGASAEYDAAADGYVHQIFLAIAGAILQQLEGTVQEGRGNSQVHRSSTELRVWHLSSDVEALFNDRRTGLMRDLIDLNFVTDRYPKFLLGAVDVNEQRAELEIDEKLWTMGVELSKAGLREHYDRQPPDPDDPDDALKKDGGGPGQPPGAPGAPPEPVAGDDGSADEGPGLPKELFSFGEGEGRSLAELLAGMLQSLEDAGEDITDDADDANEELDGSGWRVERTEDGWEAAPDDEAEAFAEPRTKRGEGEEWETKGRKYRRQGGKTVRVGSAKDVRPVRERIAERAKAGAVDRGKLASRLAAHAGEDASPSMAARAKQAAQMLTRHHGANAAHRVEDLADRLETALGNVKGDDWKAERKRSQIRGQLRQLHLAARHLPGEEKPAEEAAAGGGSDLFGNPQPKAAGSDLFAGLGYQARKRTPEEEAVSAVGHELNALSKAGQDKGEAGGFPVERLGGSKLGAWSVVIDGKRYEGDQTQVANWIAAVPKKVPPSTEPPADTAPASDGTRKGKDGTVWAKAPAGGAVSPVNGLQYKGGQWMPIHGLASGQERRPKGKGGPGERVAPGDEKGGKEGDRGRRGPMSPEDVEDLKYRRRAQAVADGPLGKLVPINPNTGLPYSGRGIGWRQWQEFAGQAGEPRLRQIADALRPTAEYAKLDYQDELEHPQGFKANAPKKHHREYPSSAEAYAAVKTALDYGSGNKIHGATLDDVERVASVLAGKAPQAPDEPPEPPKLPPPDPDAAREAVRRLIDSPQTATPDAVAYAAQHLSRLSKEQAKALQKEFGLKATDPKRIAAEAAKAAGERERYAREARKAGLSEGELFSTADEVYSHAAEYARQVRSLLADVRATYKRETGKELTALHKAFRGGDYTDVPGFERIARTMADRYPELLGAHGYERGDNDSTAAAEKLYEVMHAGVPRYAKADAYREALDLLRSGGGRGSHRPSDEEVPFRERP